MTIKRRVTIKEVAQAASVSLQTVSRVLNNRPDVSAETRERIQEIILRLGYSPNVLARSLIQGRSHTIGVVGYGLSFYGPARVLTGIERRANEVGYSLLLGLLHEPETDHGEEVFQGLISRQVDGVIWAVPEIGANRDWMIEQYAGLSVPIVFINMEPAPGLPVACVDNYQGGRLATQHLLEQGFRRIGIITGPQAWWEARQRKQGWEDALRFIGQEPREDWVVSGDWYPASGESGMTELLRRCPDLDAVFACNDPMAAGALLSARRQGRRVPEDLAIIGYDDAPESAYFTPALSTVSQPLGELGAQAVDMLYQILNTPAKETGSELPEAIWAQPQLVVRESSIRPARP